MSTSRDASSSGSILQAYNLAPRLQSTHGIRTMIFFLHMDPGKDSTTPPQTPQTPQQNNLDHDEMDHDSLRAQQPGPYKDILQRLYRVLVTQTRRGQAEVATRCSGTLSGLQSPNQDGSAASILRSHYVEVSQLT